MNSTPLLMATENSGVNAMGKDMMSKIRAGDVWKAMARVLEDFRVPKEDYDVLDKRPHPHLTVTYCGLQRSMSFPCTPRGRGRAATRYASSLRRMLKDMQMAAIGGGDTAVEAPSRGSVSLVKIPFYGSDILVKPGDSPADTLVAMKSVVEGIGLDWKSQHAKISSHAVLCEGVVNLTMPSAGGPQETTALPLTMLYLWLATLYPNKIPDLDIRQKVLTYQREAANVLFDHFFGRAVAHADSELNSRHFGISKMTIHKVTEMEKKITVLEEKINHLMVGSDARVAVLDYVTVYDLLAERHAIQHGRRSLNSRVGAALRSNALSVGCLVKRCPVTGRRLFPRDFAEAFMNSAGNAMIREHNDRQAGQTTLDLRVSK
jgi:hypothetical protein